MNLRQIYQLIGREQRIITSIVRKLALEEVFDSPLNAEVRAAAPDLRSSLILCYRRLHALEARLPTPETLSAAAYARALALGMSVEAAEADKRAAYHAARRAA